MVHPISVSHSLPRQTVELPSVIEVTVRIPLPPAEEHHAVAPLVVSQLTHRPRLWPRRGKQLPLGAVIAPGITQKPFRCSSAEQDDQATLGIKGRARLAPLR